MDDSDERIARILAEADALLERVREDKARTERMLEDGGIDLAKLKGAYERLDAPDRELVARLVREEQQRADDELERKLVAAASETVSRRPTRRSRQMV